MKLPIINNWFSDDIKEMPVFVFMNVKWKTAILTEEQAMEMLYE